ncbi:thioredoxin family protein, partial [uncultured Exiguobacterium sp.]
DEFPEIASNHDVMGIPSLLVFKNNEKLAHLHSANAKTPEEVTAFLKQNFN